MGQEQATSTTQQSWNTQHHFFKSRALLYSIGEITFVVLLLLLFMFVLYVFGIIHFPLNIHNANSLQNSASSSFSKTSANNRTAAWQYAVEMLNVNYLAPNPEAMTLSTISTQIPKRTNYAFRWQLGQEHFLSLVDMTAGGQTTLLAVSIPNILLSASTLSPKTAQSIASEYFRVRTIDSQWTCNANTNSYCYFLISPSSSIVAQLITTEHVSLLSCRIVDSRYVQMKNGECINTSSQ